MTNHKLFVKGIIFGIGVGALSSALLSDLANVVLSSKQQLVAGTLLLLTSYVINSSK